MSALALALMVSAALALWIAAFVARRPSVGTGPFLWLSAAIAVWCGAGAGHALVDSLGAKLAWAKVQYLGIATVAPLWLLFTAEYARVGWFDASSGRKAILRRRYLWAVPIVTIVLAATNEWHHAVWSSVALTGAGRAAYSYGPWFWIAAVYNYALLFTGSALVLRALRSSPGPIRTQFIALLVATLVPWVINLLYLTHVVDFGIDPTPLGFALSGVMFGWAVYRSYLFDLIPVARDIVIDSLSDAMIVIDSTRRILDLNASARQLARRKGTISSSKANWIGRDVDDLFPLLRGVPLQPTTLVEMSRTLTNEGEPAAFDIQLLPVHARGRGLDVWVVLLRDISDQRRAAADREAIQARLQEQQRRESLSILAGGLAHDFNNLLTGIVGNADLLSLRVPPSSTMGESVGAILLGAQRAADLVSKMLAYAGERHGSLAQIDVDALTRDLLDLLRASAARHCAISYEGERVLIDADPTQFRQVAMNLIINAAEAVGDSGHISIRTGRETLSTVDLTTMRVGQESVPGEYAFLEVRDDGVGMDAATMRRIFQPFFTTKIAGHGLGLAAVQGIVLGHHGALRVESKAGKGTCFRVWFPISTGAVAPQDSVAPDDTSHETDTPRWAMEAQ